MLPWHPSGSPSLRARDDDEEDFDDFEEDEELDDEDDDEDDDYEDYDELEDDFGDDEPHPGRRGGDWD